MKRTLSFIIKAAISAGLVALVARNLDVAEIGAAIAQIPIGVIAVAFVAIFVQTFLVAMRWRIIMHAIGGELGYRSAVEAVLVGLFFNQGLPSSLGGDTVRVWQVHGAGTPLRIAVRSVVIDRLVGLLALAILAGAGLPLLATRVVSRIKEAFKIELVSDTIVVQEIDPTAPNGTIKIKRFHYNGLEYS